MNDKKLMRACTRLVKNHLNVCNGDFPYLFAQHDIVSSRQGTMVVDDRCISIYLPHLLLKITNSNGKHTTVNVNFYNIDFLSSMTRRYFT